VYSVNVSEERQLHIENLDIANFDDLWMHSPFALALMTLPEAVVIRCNHRYRQIYALGLELNSSFDSLSLMDEVSKAEARVQYEKLAREPNQLVQSWRTYIDRSGRVFRGFVRAHTFHDVQSGKKMMHGAILDVDRSFEIAEDFVIRRDDEVRSGMAKVVANDLNNAVGNLLSTLEIQYGDSQHIPESIRSALNSVTQVSRKLLILGWSGERPEDSSVLAEMVDKISGFNPDLGSNDTQGLTSPFHQRHQRHQRQVLVVDDDENLASTVAEGLIAGGINSLFARSGNEAVEAAKVNSFTHAVVDLRVGDESGFAIAKTLKGLLPELSVIFMTGYATLSQVESKTHSEPILMKPFRLSEVISHILQ